MAGEERALETFLTLILADQNPALAAAHDELYPERVPEAIPLSLTLLYPFAPPSEVERHYDTLRGFFVSYEPFGFELVRLEQWDESGAVYAVPEPEQPLRELMRALWRVFPQYHPPTARPEATRRRTRRSRTRAGPIARRHARASSGVSRAYCRHHSTSPKLRSWRSPSPIAAGCARPSAWAPNVGRAGALPSPLRSRA